MNHSGTFTTLRPQSLLRQLASCLDTTCLQAMSNFVTWSIYLENGTITYATHTVEPFDRLERHLRRLSQQFPLVTPQVRVQLRLLFETDLYKQINEQQDSDIIQPPDYQAIRWLINQKYLDQQQATVLIQELVKEVIESFLLINTGNYQLSDSSQKLPVICRLDTTRVIERCQKRLQNWQTYLPKFTSPYQRPYLLLNHTIPGKTTPELQPQLTYWMKGFSLRHLAIIMNQDEMQLAQYLYPYIIAGEIILHEPDPPFDQLPKVVTELPEAPEYTTALLEKKLVETVVELSSNATPITPIVEIENVAIVKRSQISTSTTATNKELNNTNSSPERVIPATVTPEKLYKIVSVDDSPTILKEISYFLETENFTVITISDPLKAAMSIIRHKPDLILLDLNMAGIDGYELCRIIRNNSMFKNTPIIFVTGYKGIVDKVKARLVGASGYLTKPFTRAELLKMVFMHLT
ncbi:two-component system response regulator [Nostoc sp. CENA543]|uniref:response regulator n=1 Tax=Nostoc sp. CENA543 TaxID=1869241 RepID=UPI000CA0A83C|nr:response regulator [Nostoc sp. CENA543]AUT01596.1 two-component system response regulator [Nostoc sp. CENA543]